MQEEARLTLYAIILANVITFVNQDNYRRWIEAHSIYDGSFWSVMASMFYHADEPHLASNMFGLLRFGTEVFVNSSSPTWQSPFAILAIYLGSGFGGAYGTKLLSDLYDSQWNRRLEKNRAAARCSHWLCESVGWNHISQQLADIYTHINNAEEAMALWHHKLVRRIGASGAVYGVLGARIYTSLYSPWHRKLNEIDAFFIVADIAYQMSRSTLNLSELKNYSFLGDGIDHACHVFGLLSGALLAAVVIRIQKKRSRGRRLGRN